jgi:hypothetical protein
MVIFYFCILGLLPSFSIIIRIMIENKNRNYFCINVSIHEYKIKKGSFKGTFKQPFFEMTVFYFLSIFFK